MQYVCGQMSRAALYKEPVSRLPAAASCLGRHAHPAGRSPNSSSLFPPQAAVGSAAVRIHPCSPFCKTDKTETPVPIGYRSSWWSEATQIRTIAPWGILGGNFIESDGFCAVFVVERNQNFFIIEINSIHECIDKRLPVAFHVRVELAEVGEPKFYKICTDLRLCQLFFRDADLQFLLLSFQFFQASFGRAGQDALLNRI